MSTGYAIHVFVCENERPDGHPRGCCSARCSGDLRSWFKEVMSEHGILLGNRVNRAGCLNYCEQGPTVVVYPQGIWYSPRTREDVEEIVSKHFVDGEVVDRLVLRRGV